MVLLLPEEVSNLPTKPESSFMLDMSPHQSAPYINDKTVDSDVPLLHQG